MSVAIETVTISSIADKRLLLGNAHWAATISAGTSWNRLRIAARMALDDTGADISGTPRLYLGMLASPTVGLTNGPLNAACSHFVGMITNNAVAFRFSGPPTSYGFGSAAATQLIGKKVGASITMAGSNVDHRLSSTPGTIRQVSMVEIEKGSPNFTVRVGLFGGTPGDISETLLISSLENTTFSGGASVVSQGNTSSAFAVTEGTDGYFNSICVGWDRSSSKLHVSEMYYAIYS